MLKRLFNSIVAAGVGAAVRYLQGGYHAVPKRPRFGIRQTNALRSRPYTTYTRNKRKRYSRRVKRAIRKKTLSNEGRNYRLKTMRSKRSEKISIKLSMLQDGAFLDPQYL